MGNITFTPRWLHKKVTVSGDIDNIPSLVLPAETFANQEIWNWHLKWISVTGVCAVTTAVTDPYEFGVIHGGTPRRLKWNIGASQKGDINLDSITSDSLMGCNHRQRQSYTQFDSAFVFDFPIPFPLPPDTGINAEVRLNFYSYDDSLYEVGYPGISLMGYKKLGGGHKRPALLAGHLPTGLSLGSNQPLENADLWNDGDSDLMITQMLIQPCQLNQNGVDSRLTIYQPEANVLTWRINPSSGTPWMPRSELIPAGNIAPFNRAFADWNDVGPRVYTLPPETILKPKQRLGLEIENLSEDDRELDICVFGMLEVQ